MDTSSSKKVLEMLSEGKITVDEATTLLERLNARENTEAAAESATTGTAASRELKYLRVVVDSADGDKVNVRVPLSLIKTGIKLKALIPVDVAEKIGGHGLDLSQLSELDGDALIEALRELQVDVDSSGGDKVRVFTE
jgi:hypothetical protein